LQADDQTIFQAARQANAIVMTKDQDFVTLQERFGAPPKLIWVTCGNTSNAYLNRVLERVLNAALALLDQGEDLVEITDNPSLSPQP
jgi:predicted nuclease of predicted toxin-antitoxin system